MKLKLALIAALLVQVAFAQKNCNVLYSQKFTKQQLEEDIDFIRTKITNAHVNPYTEISKSEFEKNIQIFVIL